MPINNLDILPQRHREEFLLIYLIIGTFAGSGFITRTTIYGSGYATNGSAYGKTRTIEIVKISIT